MVRRFRLSKSAGTCDPVTCEAMCQDVVCAVPVDGEIGGFIGAQNAAANLNGPDFYPPTITVVGDGQVSDSTSTIRCPGTRSMSVKPGLPVTLTVRNGKGVFSGWTGACVGNSTTCTFNVNSDAPVTATFRATYRLVMKTNGSGFPAPGSPAQPRNRYSCPTELFVHL